MLDDVDQSVYAWLRHGRDGEASVLVACNFTPVPRPDYRIGVPVAGYWREIMNSDAEVYGGSNMGNGGAAASENIECHGRPFSLRLTLPPLAVVAFKL